MKLAIHNSKTGFHPRWAHFCAENDIPYKLVDCYANDLIEQLKDCDGLMWHHNQSIAADILIAKQILFALEHTGFKVFPDFKTSWHFDDKVAQKYLLEKFDLPLVPSYVFFDKKTAMEWVEKTSFPKVFKLRGGAGSANVKLLRSRAQAQKMVSIAFGKGFKQYDALYNLKDRWYKYKIGKTGFFQVMKGVARIGMEPEFSRTKGRERGYIYFQDFIPNNDSDTRIIVINGRAFGAKRMVRKGDFRASGSLEFYFEKEMIDERCVKLAFEINKKIKSQSLVLDFVYDAEKNPLLIEMSYGFATESYNTSPGFWDSNLVWHEHNYNPQIWMVEGMLQEIRRQDKTVLE